MHTTPKRHSIRLALAFTALAALATVGANAAAARPHGHGHHGQGFDMLSLLEKRVSALELDETTRANVTAVIDAAKPAQTDLKARLKAEHDAMRSVMESDTPDEATVLAHADRIGEITTELRKQHLRTMLAVKAQLTPEQREALRPKHGEGWKDGRGHHGRHGGKAGCEHKGAGEGAGPQQ